MKAFIAANAGRSGDYYQKQLFSRMPARPIVKFLFLYVSNGGFLDGKAGFTYSVLQAFYEYMIILKVREMDRECSAGGRGSEPCFVTRLSGVVWVWSKLLYPPTGV